MSSRDRNEICSWEVVLGRCMWKTPQLYVSRFSRHCGIHCIFYLFTIPDDGQSPQPQWFWVLYTVARTLQILLIPFQYKANNSVTALFKMAAYLLNYQQISACYLLLGLPNRCSDNRDIFWVRQNILRTSQYTSQYNRLRECLFPLCCSSSWLSIMRKIANGGRQINLRQKE
jgi:hypothetical protein